MMTTFATIYEMPQTFFFFFPTGQKNKNKNRKKDPSPRLWTNRPGTDSQNPACGRHVWNST